MLRAHLAFDGFKAGHPAKLQIIPFVFENLAFEVEPEYHEYHDPEYGCSSAFALIHANCC